MSSGISFMALLLMIVVGGAALVGLIALIIWLVKQGQGAKGSMGDARARMEEMEQDINDK